MVFLNVIAHTLCVVFIVLFLSSHAYICTRIVLTDSSHHHSKSCLFKVSFSVRHSYIFSYFHHAPEQEHRCFNSGVKAENGRQRLSLRCSVRAYVLLDLTNTGIYSHIDRGEIGVVFFGTYKWQIFPQTSFFSSENMKARFCFYFLS